MHAQVIRIGNSKGIRIPAALLKACRIEEEVDIELTDGKLVITPITSPRQGWDDSFVAMHAADEDEPYLAELPDDDIEDWTW